MEEERNHEYRQRKGRVREEDELTAKKVKVGNGETETECRCSSSTAGKIKDERARALNPCAKRWFTKSALLVTRCLINKTIFSVRHACHSWSTNVLVSLPNRPVITPMDFHCKGNWSQRHTWSFATLLWWTFKLPCFNNQDREQL